MPNILSFPLSSHPFLSPPYPSVPTRLSPIAKEHHMQLKAEEKRVAALHLQEVAQGLARLRAECEKEKEIQFKWLVEENKR